MRGIGIEWDREREGVVCERDQDREREGVVCERDRDRVG